MKDMPLNEPTVFFGSDPLISSFINDTPQSGETVIYSIHLPEYNHLVEDLKIFLDIKEHERAVKYYKDTDKNRFIISRILLKFALARYTQSTINDIMIELLPNKKPYAPKYPKVFFNVSHSGHYTILAISNNPIGIDIEYINLNTNFHDILQYVFDDIEIQFINNAVNQTKAFYSLWTRKEAFVKALGKGIDDDFFKIPCLGGRHVLYPSLLTNSQHWRVHNFTIDVDDYIGAIAMPLNQFLHDEKLPLNTFPTTLESLMRMSQ
jgi:4'-phosphopantetheinyl transferase